MLYEVVMPQLGMTMTEGSVLRWFKQAGDRVEKGEPLLEVQTDKVDMEVEAPCSGIVSQVFVPAEKVVPVGSIIALICGEGENLCEPRSISVPSIASGAATGPAMELRPSIEPAEPHRVSHRARRVAEELGIDLASVQAWKEGGRIVEADVRSYAEQNRAASMLSARNGRMPPQKRSLVRRHGGNPA